MVMFIVLHFRHLCSSLKVQSNARKNRLCNLFQFLRFQFLNNEGVRFSGLKEFATCLIHTMIRKAVSWPQSCHYDEFSSRFVTSAFGAILRTVSHFYPWGEILTGSIISPRSYTGKVIVTFPENHGKKSAYSCFFYHHCLLTCYFGVWCFLY